DTGPGPVCGGLPSHRIEAGRKGVVFGKLRTERLKVILPDAPRVHPEPQRLIAYKLRGTNRFVNRGLLGLVGPEFVFQNQHGYLAFWRLHGWLFLTWPYARYRWLDSWH